VVPWRTREFFCGLKNSFKKLRPRSGQDDAVGEKEVGRLGRLRDIDVGRDGVCAVLLLQSGVDVIITIFSDFCQFSAKK
jgi:hypothetical protein